MSDIRCQPTFKKHRILKMSTYRCAGRHTLKTDVYYFGDGIHKLFYERCCTEPVAKAGTICAKHQKRFEGEYKTKDPRLLCQWNYVFHHGLIGEAYNPHTQMYGSPYYAEGLKKGWGAPKKQALEKAAAMQKEVCDLAVSMQMKITDFIKTSMTLAEEAGHEKPEASPTEGSSSPKKTKAKSGPKKKRVQGDQTSTSSSASSTNSSNSSGTACKAGPPMYIPKGPVAYAEAEDDPIIITAAQISTLQLQATPKADTWVDTEGKHYRRLASGIIECE